MSKRNAIEKMKKRKKERKKLGPINVTLREWTDIGYWKRKHDIVSSPKLIAQ
jgi:hypothetical protein